MARRRKIQPARRRAQRKLKDLKHKFCINDVAYDLWARLGRHGLSKKKSRQLATTACNIAYRRK